MNILIDFSQIPIKKTGVGVYALNLLTKIYETDKINQYYILSQDDDDSLNFIKRTNFKIIRLHGKIFRKFFFRIIAEQFYIPVLVFKYKIKLVHSLHYSFPVFLTCSKIVTIHDLTFFKYPENHLLVKRYYFRFFTRLAAILADRIITVSKSSARDFIQKFNFNPSKIYVVFHGKNESYQPELDKKQITFVKNKLNIQGEYLLFLGTIEPRKNVNNLILAFKELIAEKIDLKLVIAGKKGWYYEEVFKLAKNLNLAKRIIFTGFLEDKDVPYLIGGAKIFVYPSLYEGFGIPVLEAISCGIPTITSNISSMPEIVENAGLLIDPKNINEIYSAIKRLLVSEELYIQLKQKSVEQAKKFSWEQAARDTIKVYESV